MKAVVVGILMFALGVAAGARFYGRAPGPEISSSTLTKLQQLTEADLEDYYRLKSAEEKYRKADEILGKIMAIFLADLGLHLSPQAQSAAHEPLPSFTPPQVSESRAVKAAPAAPPPQPAPEASAPLRIGMQEKQLLGVRSERDLDSALAKVRIADLDSALKSSVRLTNTSLVHTLNGRFGGTASVSYGGKAREWAVQLDFTGAVTSGQLEGHCKVTLSDEGRVFSKSEDKGTQTNFRQLSGDPHAVLLKVSPTLQFQLYYLPDLERLAGNVYRREGEDGAFAYVGTVLLSRN